MLKDVKKESFVMKKIVSILMTAMLLATAEVGAMAADIPDHKGTDISAIPMGTAKVSSNLRQYYTYFKQSGDQYGIDPNILVAVCMQESGGRNINYGPAHGIMQIEYTCERDFADYGYDQTGVRWTLNDRLDPSKAVPYAAYRLASALYKYDCDYAKMLQSYNFSTYTLDKIIAAKGDDWMAECPNAVNYVSNWNYSSYGDGKYVEHVLRYYHHDIDYIGGKVRLDGSLVKFENQYPIIEDGTMMVPVSAVAKALGAEVAWDGAKQHVGIRKNGTGINIYIGSTAADVNDVLYELERPAEVVNNTTLVPLRFVVDALGFDIEWNGTTRTAELYS